MSERPPELGPARAPHGRGRRGRLRWAHARAALLAFALAVQAVAACPVTVMSLERLERPDRRRALDVWAARLTSVGLKRSPDELARDLVASSRHIATLRDRALAPFEPYFELTRTDQRWGLFVDATSTRYRMHIEGQDASGAWALLYRPLDPSARALAGALEYRRVRAVWNPRARETRPPYRAFVDWVARTLFARDPTLRAVRVRMERFQIPRPGEPPDPETSWHFEEARHRPGRP